MDSSKASSVVVAAVVMIVLCGLLVIARIWSRFWILRHVGLDDGLIIASWVCSLVIGPCVIAATHYGLGYHRQDVSYDNYRTFLKLQTAASVSYSWSMCFAKASFAILYLKLIPEKRISILNKCVCTFLFLQAIEESFVTIFRCSPIVRAWDPQLEGTCINISPMWYCTFVFNIITDLILFIEPMPSMWKLQLPLAKRIGLIFMLSLGLMVTSLAVIRIKYVVSISTDDTYELAEPLIWSIVENNALIMCSCIPSLRQVVTKIPGLSKALGLSSLKDSYPDRSNSKGPSIALHSRPKSEYIQSQKRFTQSKYRGGNQFGTTSHAMAARDASDAGSTDEIFPHKSDENGVIMVTKEFVQDVEANHDKSDSQHQVVPPELMAGQSTRLPYGQKRSFGSSSSLSD